VATGQAFAIRKRLLEPVRDEDTAIAHANEQLRLREKARKICTTNPSLAHELQIGRPDIPRRFDDGGLVDVNRVPLDCLAQLPGVDRSIAERITDVRDGIGGFSSIEDLSVTLGIHPHALDQAAGRMIFIR
jgi:DNA uptake protein ComE-like DNA-binding protein